MESRPMNSIAGPPESCFCAREAGEILLIHRDHALPDLLRGIPTGLSDDVLHVWCVKIGGEAETREFELLLSHDEEERADSYRFSGDRERFVFCRGVLRILLGHYLGEEPGSVRFAYGPLGKPYLSGEHRHREISFSLSHSHEFTFFAFTGKGEVGVDIEHIRPLPNVDEMARRLFSEDDYESFRRLPRDMRETIYLRAWTLKEARLKAVGYEFPDLQVRLRDVVEPVSSLRLMGSSSSPEGSRLYSFQPLPDYVASLCVTAS